MRRGSYEMVQTRGNAAYGGNWLTCGLVLIFRESFFYIKRVIIWRWTTIKRVTEC